METPVRNSFSCSNVCWEWGSELMCKDCSKSLGATLQCLTGAQWSLDYAVLNYHPFEVIFFIKQDLNDCNSKHFTSNWCENCSVHIISIFQFDKTFHYTYKLFCVVTVLTVKIWVLLCALYSFLMCLIS